MFAVGSLTSTSALSLLNMATVVEPNGPVYNGPGASKPNKPFLLRTLELHQREAVEKAKKYAMEQSIRAVLLKQTQSQQSQQLNNIKKNQTVALLNRVYVGSISYDVREDSLRQSFSAFGSIKTVSMSWDPATQKHKGFAFLEFEYPEAAQLAIDQMNNASFGGRQLKVGRPSNLVNAEPIIAELVAEYKLENRIYVSGVHMDLTEDDLALVFEAFGKIVFCRLLVDPNRLEPHRGFGYIEYQNAQSAADAVASMNQFNLGGQLLRVCKAISPPEGISNPSATALPPAAAVAAASVTAKVLSMETEQLSVNATQPLEENSDPLPASTVSMAATSSLPGHVTNYHVSGFDVRNQHAIEEMPAHTSDRSMAQQLSSWEPAVSEEQPTTTSLPNISSIPLPPENSVGIGKKGSFVHTPTPTSIPGILVLRNMVGPEDCDDELQGEVTSECSRYGAVERVVIHQQLDPQTNEFIVKVFVHFSTLEAVHNAVEALNGRFFAGRQIRAEPYDLGAFAINDFSH
ncbi:Poly-U binding splicing factor b [Paragonimus heterotremus]|uniref:Poly-U binding splicing factor b n=1 Tax=Paragonimus heterotremus TaxID=100268 RepID=A0A8J4WEJ9_9TREM|nr:Poly-U binding splicing factor b [Paragonimus heterotremus]